MTAGIYMITGAAYLPSSHGDNAYFGKSIDVDRRLSDHKRDLSKGKHPNDYLQNYCNKHGIDSIKFVVMQECAPAELDEMEKKFIKENFTYENPKAFNMTTGGDGGATRTLEFAFENVATGEIVAGDNILSFCRLHPELNKDCMYRVHRALQEEHQGWRKAKPPSQTNDS